MTIYTTRFVFANHSSDEFGALKCIIETSGDSNDEQTSLIISKIPTKKVFDFHYLDYTEPLTFKITICNQDGSYIDADQERILKKWLCKETRNWIHFDQPDLSDKYFYCIIHNPRKQNAGNMTIGIDFDLECDAGFGWSGVYKKQYTTSSGNLNFQFPVSLDFDTYLLAPTFYITPLSNGTVSIRNNTTNQTMTISNCVTTEVITIDNENEIFESTNGRVLLDSWNKGIIDIVDGLNSFTLTGNFTLRMEYRLPRRIGG